MKRLAKLEMAMAGGQACKTDSSLRTPPYPATHVYLDLYTDSVLQQVLPVPGQADDATHGKHEGVSVTIEKPNFSLPTMSNNFKRFNAR